jgi:hypothetical protein
MPFNLIIKPERLTDLAKALKAEEDGKELRRELLRNFRTALAPARDAARAAIKSMPVKGRHGVGGQQLRAGIARRIVVQTRLSGKFPGVSLKAKKTPNIRDFSNAPKRMQRRKGFRHPVFGDTEWWVTQMGKPGWFDNAVDQRRGEYRRAVAQVLDEMAERIKRRTRM